MLTTYSKKVNSMKKIFAVVIVTPILALFTGIGVLAFNIADTWDTRNTDVLISGLVTACGIGGVVVALVLGAFVALAFYARWQRDKEWSPPSRVLPKNQVPNWDAPPPLQLEDKKGYLHSTGPAGYEDLLGDVFSDTISIDDESWRFQ